MMLQYKKLLIKLLIVCFAFIANQSYAQILKTGKWVQLEFKQTGAYKITYNDLKNYGFNLISLNPKKLHFYTVQGNNLSLINSSAKESGTEIPIFVFGQEDNSFDPSDYIIIFKQSIKDVSYEDANLLHFNNFYSNKSFGLLGFNATDGQRINSIPHTNLLQCKKIENTLTYHVHDSDIVNPTTMGNYWVGEKLGNEFLERTFIEKISPNADSITIKLSLGIAMYNDTGSVYINVNGLSKMFYLRQNNPDNEVVYDYTVELTVPKVLTNDVKLYLKLNRRNTQSGVYLNYYKILYQKPIELGKGQYSIINPELLYTASNKEILFNTSNLDYRYLDVTNCNLPQFIEPFDNGGSISLKIKDTQKISRLWVFNLNELTPPALVGTIENQDIVDGNLDMVIISHPDFLKASNDLAEFRKSNDLLNVKVVTPQQIYNEFSGTQQDLVALREYLKAEYSKSNGKLKYVLLLGAASFDMQNRVSNNSNFIPIYQSNGYFKSQVFCLDDVLGYFEIGKGNPETTNSNKMSVSIGRIPCRTLIEAQGVVNKIKRYESPKALGSWRNKITFVTDDVDKNWETIFTNQSESYARNILKSFSNLRVNKIYSDAYTQVTNGNNQKYPAVSNAINNSISEGTLLMNYQGHGGEKGWAQEAFLDIPMINSWNNKYNMPIMFTATCEFSRFDDPKFQSGGELTLLNPNGGAIALMSTTRLVFVSGNSDINNAFWTNYGFPKPNEPLPTLGQMYTKLKNRPKTQYETEDTKFALLGDPSMKLAFPKNLVLLDSINGQEAVTFKDTIKAFSVVKLKGHINERLKGKMTDFNGSLEVEILDKPILKYTLNNDKEGGELQFLSETGVIYKGSVSVTNGDFNLIFTVPKDISYNLGEGRAIFYAQNGITDASGSWIFTIGGSENIKEIDTIGPEVYAFMNDTTFKNGGKVFKNTKFVGRVFDYSGINATGTGIGRDLEIVIDPETENEKSFVVNSYFKYDENSYKQGTIIFPLDNLDAGKHKIRCNAWDIYNNSGRGYIEFEVVPGRSFEINEFGAKPNPAVGEDVNLWINHNLSGEDIEINWHIFSTNGSEIASGKHTEIASTSVFNAVVWDGKGKNGNVFNDNMYFYKIQASTADGMSKIVSGKFIKLR